MTARVQSLCRAVAAEIHHRQTLALDEFEPDFEIRRAQPGQQAREERAR